MSEKKVKKGGRPPPALGFLRKHVMLGENNISYVSSTEYPGVYADADDLFNFESFKANFVLRLISRNTERIEFDLIGVDASIANAIRRILLSEVPTMAIEKVFVMNNTSIVHDEILAHRLGLIPIYADPRKFELKGEDDDPTDLNTIVFTLQVKCERNPAAPPDAADPKVKYINSSVYSRQLQWVPQGDQEDVFKDDPIRPVHDDILIAKLRPGQEIDLQLHCEKGIGKTHAKWSPVATASYRLMPEITLLEEIEGELAEKLAKCFSAGVIEVKENEQGRKVAHVANPRNDSTSREVYRHEDLASKVQLAKKRDHFIFFIESVGILPPEELLKESIKILIEKTRVIKSSLAKIIDPDLQNEVPDEEMEEQQEKAVPQQMGREGEGEEEEEEAEEAEEEEEFVHGRGAGDDDDDDRD